MKQTELDFTPITITGDTSISTTYDDILSSDYTYTTNYTTNDGTYTMCDVDLSDITITTGAQGSLFGDTSSSITLGNVVLTEQKLERLSALLDLFENDQELEDLLRTQIALNRIKNET